MKEKIKYISLLLCFTLFAGNAIVQAYSEIREFDSYQTYEKYDDVVSGGGISEDFIEDSYESEFIGEENSEADRVASSGAVDNDKDKDKGNGSTGGSGSNGSKQEETVSESQTEVLTEEESSFEETTEDFTEEIFEETTEETTDEFTETTTFGNGYSSSGSGSGSDGAIDGINENIDVIETLTQEAEIEKNSENVEDFSEGETSDVSEPAAEGVTKADDQKDMISETKVQESITEAATEGTTSSELVSEEETETETVSEEENKIIKVTVPTNIGLTLDPFEIAGKGQIYSDEYFVCNYSNTDVAVKISRVGIKYLQEKEVYVMSDEPVPYDENSGLKKVNLIMNWHNENGESKDIAIDENVFDQEVIRLRAASGENFEKGYFSFGGSLNANPYFNWLNNDFEINISFDIEEVK